MEEGCRNQTVRGKLGNEQAIHCSPGYRTNNSSCHGSAGFGQGRHETVLPTSFQSTYRGVLGLAGWDKLGKATGDAGGMRYSSWLQSAQQNKTGRPFFHADSAEGKHYFEGGGGPRLQMAGGYSGKTGPGESRSQVRCSPKLLRIHKNAPDDARYLLPTGCAAGSSFGYRRSPKYMLPG